MVEDDVRLDLPSRIAVSFPLEKLSFTLPLHLGSTIVIAKSIILSAFYLDCIRYPS
jgi:hypothetical protein